MSVDGGSGQPHASVVHDSGQGVAGDPCPNYRFEHVPSGGNHASYIRFVRCRARHRRDRLFRRRLVIVHRGTHDGHRAHGSLDAAAHRAAVRSGSAGGQWRGCHHRRRSGHRRRRPDRVRYVGFRWFGFRLRRGGVLHRRHGHQLHVGGSVVRGRRLDRRAQGHRGLQDPHRGAASRGDGDLRWHGVRGVAERDRRSRHRADLVVVVDRHDAPRGGVGRCVGATRRGRGWWKPDGRVPRVEEGGPRALRIVEPSR